MVKAEMPSPLVLVHGLALALSLLFLLFLQRQKMTLFAPVKQYLVVGYSLVTCWSALNFLNLTLQSPQTAILFALVGVTAILLAIVPATFASEIIVREVKGGEGEGARTGRSIGGLTPPALAITAAVAALVFVLLAFTPFTVKGTPSGFGGVVYDPSYAWWYTVALTALAAGFIAYPCRRVFVRGSRLGPGPARTAMTLLPLSWALFAVLAVGLGLYLPRIPSASPVVGLAGAALLAASAYLFRGTNLLDRLFAPQPLPTRPPPAHAKRLSARLGLEGRAVLGHVVLLEYDPSAGYEKDVLDYVEEVGGTTLVVAQKGGPVALALAETPGLRFLLLDSDVSYPKPGERESEVLVPESNSALLLEALSKGFGESAGGASLVFAALSDMLVASGTKATYDFLKKFFGFVPGDKSTLFLLVDGAHDPATVALLRSLFNTQAVHDPKGLRVVKRAR